MYRIYHLIFLLYTKHLEEDDAFCGGRFLPTSSFSPNR